MLQGRVVSEGAVVADCWIDDVVELDNAARGQVVISLPEEPGPVPKGPGQEARKDEVEWSRKRPVIFDIINVEVTVRRDTRVY